MNVIQIHPKDSVLVAIDALRKGDTVNCNGESYPVHADIPAGHKLAIREVPAGGEVVKYGELIGYAKEDIHVGDWVHVHNLRTSLSSTLTYTYHPTPSAAPTAKPHLQNTFQGFLRENNEAGVRNEIFILPTVGCVNGIAEALAQYGENKLRQKGPENTSVNAVIAFPHPYGCSQLGDDQEYTRKILACLANHPNAGAVLVVGLGCENSGVDILKTYIGDYNEKRIQFLVSQDYEDEIAAGQQMLDKLICYAETFTRRALPVEQLVIGLKCGGSDGFSGITANPVVGRFSDLLTAMGGTTILTEVPEMFGAEQSLMDRAKTKEIFSQTVALINDFKAYYEQMGMPIYENPSPGNKAGGISTLEDKSLGCTQKSGTSPVCGVLAYGERVNHTGLQLLSAPGNDLVAATALAASGAQIVLFTTGRGTPFASPVPTVKISSNTDLYQKKSRWIDFDAGRAVRGTSIDTLGEELYDFVLAAAEGKLVKSEECGYHDMAIFKTGVTL